MIYISYGVTKSASTYTYELTDEILREAGFAPARKRLPERPENYTDWLKDDALNGFIQTFKDRSFVLKTHGGPDCSIVEQLGEGTVFASASIRDPRDLCLSMLDHGVRARELGKHEFSELKTFEDTLPELDGQFRTFRRWAAYPRVLILTYDEVCFDVKSVIMKISSQIGRQVDSRRVLDRLDKTSIRQFNKGVKSRHSTEMSSEIQEVFLKRYRDIYDKFLYRGIS